MNKVFQNKSIRTSLCLLAVLAVTLLALGAIADPHFTCHCRHALTPLVTACLGIWLGIGKWYQSWNKMQQVIPLVLAFFLMARFLLSQKGTASEHLREGRINWFRLRGEAGLACLVASYLTVISGIPNLAFQTAALTATAFLIVQVFAPELRLAFKKWQVKNSLSRRLQVKAGDKFGYENPDGAWVEGPIKEVEEEFYCLDVEDPKHPGEFWDLWVPRLKFADSPWKHQPQKAKVPPATTKPASAETPTEES